ncbi:alpha/beta hydrolase [Nonomuraea sp. NPDC050536]|uniref:alpha/beta hydrolase n=1 Tax=Nonomuraea sp. NPDC050536 TaxID=3364366 RepID=UPI0037CC022C
MSGRIAAGVCVLALSPVLGLAALAGMSTVSRDPRVFTITGLAAFGAVFFLGLLLCVPRPRSGWGRWLRALAVLGVEAFAVWHVSEATLNPGAFTPPPAVSGQREWRLDTGSRLAYVRIAPKRVTRPDPVVVVDGVTAAATLGLPLTREGFQVYGYDRLGSGRSERLADPRRYGLTRDVSDLESVRQAIGAKRMLLIAHGDGARLATAYLAAHPDQVARVVLDSPAALDGGPATALSALQPGTAELARPRELAVYTLMRLDPVAAHAFAGDAEVDARLDERLRHEVAGPGCPEPTPSGPGGYASLTSRPPGQVRDLLAEVTTPVLIVKRRCDKESWSAALEYRHALPGSVLAYAPGTGAVRAFLLGDPVRGVPTDTPPADFIGPR